MEPVAHRSPLASVRVRPVLPYLALGFGVLALTFSSLFIRWSKAPGPVTAFYRMAFAALLLLPFFVVHLHRRGLPRPFWLIFPLIGGLFTTLDHGLWSMAIDQTRVANATLLNNVAPVWVALFAALAWKEHLDRRFWLGLTISLLGAALVLGTDLLLAPEYTVGNILALLSSVFYAGYFLTTQRGRTHLDAFTYVWLINLFCALGLLVFTQAFRMPLTGFNAQTWVIFLSAALVSQIGGYLSIAYALGHLPASVVSPTMVSQPVLTAMLAIPLAGEMLAPAQWLGVMAVVAGIYLVNSRRRKAV